MTAGERVSKGPTHQWLLANRRGFLGPRQKRLMKVLERDGFRCWLCGDKIYNPVTELHLLTNQSFPSLDHVIPRCKGGTMSLDNLRAAHRICNNDRAKDEKLGWKEAAKE